MTMREQLDAARAAYEEATKPKCGRTYYVTLLGPEQRTCGREPGHEGNCKEGTPPDLTPVIGVLLEGMEMLLDERDARRRARERGEGLLD